MKSRIIKPLQFADADALTAFIEKLVADKWLLTKTMPEQGDGYSVAYAAPPLASQFLIASSGDIYFLPDLLNQLAAMTEDEINAETVMFVSSAKAFVTVKQLLAMTDVERRKLAYLPTIDREIEQAYNSGLSTHLKNATLQLDTELKIAAARKVFGGVSYFAEFKVVMDAVSLMEAISSYLEVSNTKVVLAGEGILLDVGAMIFDNQMKLRSYMLARVKEQPLLTTWLSEVEGHLSLIKKMLQTGLKNEKRKLDEINRKEERYQMLHNNFVTPLDLKAKLAIAKNELNAKTKSYERSESVSNFFKPVVTIGLLVVLPILITLMITAAMLATVAILAPAAFFFTLGITLAVLGLGVMGISFAMLTSLGDTVIDAYSSAASSIEKMFDDSLQQKKDQLDVLKKEVDQIDADIQLFEDHVDHKDKILAEKTECEKNLKKREDMYASIEASDSLTSTASVAPAVVVTDLNTSPTLFPRANSPRTTAELIPEQTNGNEPVMTRRMSQ